MSIMAMILAGALGLPLLAGTAFAVETKSLQGAAALIAAAERNDAQTIDRLLGSGADPSIVATSVNSPASRASNAASSPADAIQAVCWASL